VPSSPRVAGAEMQRTYVQVDRNDVLFGQGSGPNRHHGNIVYNGCILALHPVYTRSDDAAKKKDLIDFIIVLIDLSGGRFLKNEETPEGNIGYYVASDKDVHDKVSRALRGDRRRPCFL
jgi:hypothetical protein